MRKYMVLRGVGWSLILVWWSILFSLLNDLGAQQTQQLTFQAPSPPAPRTLNGSYNGDRGSDTWFYWVVATHPRGQSPLDGPLRIDDAAVLSATNTVALSWSRAAGATSYSVLRTTTNVFPGGNCACAVATGVTLTSQVDIGSALGAFTHTGVGGATATIRLDNQAYSTAQLVFDLPPSGTAFFPQVQTPTAPGSIYGETALTQNPAGTTVPSFDVTDCTNASPIVVTTSAAHGVLNGDWVVIEDVTGNAACNTFAEVSGVTATTLILDGTTGNGAYIANGILGGFKVAAGTWAIGNAANFSANATGLLTYTAAPARTIFAFYTTSSTPVTDVGNPICHYGIFHDTHLLPRTISSRNLPSTAARGTSSGFALVQVLSSDTLQLKVACIEPSGAASFDVLLEHASLLGMVF